LSTRKPKMNFLSFAGLVTCIGPIHIGIPRDFLTRTVVPEGKYFQVFHSQNTVTVCLYTPEQGFNNDFDRISDSQRKHMSRNLELPILIESVPKFNYNEKTNDEKELIHLNKQMWFANYSEEDEQPNLRLQVLHDFKRWLSIYIRRMNPIVHLDREGISEEYLATSLITLLKFTVCGRHLYCPIYPFEKLTFQFMKLNTGRTL
jgi:hypothetical protein